MTETWTQASSEGIYLNQSIVNDGGQLKLVGGFLPDPEFPDSEFSFQAVPLRSYDLATGAGEELCSLPKGFSNPIAAAKDGTILIYSADTNYEFIRVQDGEAVLLDEAAPDFFLAEEGEEVDGAWGNVMRNQYLSVLAPVSDGFVLAGPPSTEGISDTYIRRDGADRFEPYEKRSSDDRVYSQAGCTYRGRLFLIGSAWFEPETRLFRATVMDVPEYPGDIPCQDEASIMYDPAGGTVDGDTEPVVVKVNVGDVVIILAAPTREGYTFLYWKDADAEYHPGDKYTVVGDHTFTAVWEKKAEAPETGDNFALAEYLVTAAVALGLLLVLSGVEVRRRRRKV